MTETAGAVENGFVLRVSLPAAGELGAVGAELGVKLAEQLGVPRSRAMEVGEAMATLARAVGAVATGDISYAFHKDGGELRIEARQGNEARTATVPLSA